MAEEYWWKEYTKNTYGIEMASGPYTQIGVRRPRILAGPRVQGKLQFTSDVREPGMLHAVILGSPYAHAKVNSIDTSEALNMPGVETVMTYQDTFGIRGYDGYALFPEPGGEVNMYGQPIAAVLADNPDRARDAIEKIKVTYEVLPHVLMIEDAIKPGAPQAITGTDNVGTPRTTERGSVDDGFAEADYIVETMLYPNKCNINPNEPRIATAKWEGGPVPYGKLTVWAKTAGVFFVRMMMAMYLGIPQNRIRVIAKATGGYYGCMSMGSTIECMVAALGAMKTGKMVRCNTEKKGDNTFTCAGHAWYQTEMKFGAKADGTLTAMQCKSYPNGGAFGSASVQDYIFDLYQCPNLYMEYTGVHTNTANPQFYRSVNCPYTNAFVECTMDMLAEEVGMDPTEFRMKNLIGPIHYNGKPFSTHNIEAVFNKTKAAIDWDNQYHAPGTKTLADGRLHGIALSGNNDNHGASGTVGDMFIKVNSDGSVHQLNGAVDSGTGTYTHCAVVIAEELGIDPSVISVTNADTDTTAEHGPAWGSTRTVGTGWGATTAALDVKRQLADAAIATYWPDATPEDLEFKDNTVTNKKTGDVESFTSVAGAASSMLGGPVIGRGYTPPTPAEYSSKYHQQNWSAHACEMAVDPETGEIEVLKYVSCHDVGPVMAPTQYDNQVQGGAMQGISIALFEQIFYDPDTGVSLNHNWEDYRVATFMDVVKIDSVPAVTLVDGVPDLPVCKINHHGVRGCAEPFKCPQNGLLANAFYNATGVRPTIWPLTPDHVIPLLKGEEVVLP